MNNIYMNVNNFLINVLIINICVNIQKCKKMLQFFTLTYLHISFSSELEQNNFINIFYYFIIKKIFNHSFIYTYSRNQNKMLNDKSKYFYILKTISKICI